MGVEAVIFDMGGVILNDRLESIIKGVADKLYIDAKEFSDFYSIYKDDLQKGKKRIKEFCELTKNKYNVNQDVYEVWRDVYETKMSINMDLLDYVDTLRAKYKAGVITNTSDLHAEINKSRGIFEHFDASIISSEVGFLKPDKRVYELMLEKLRLRPEDCIFIDDRKEHLETAEMMGFSTVLYVDNPKCIASVNRLLAQ